MKKSHDREVETSHDGFGEVIWADPDSRWEDEALVWWTTEFSWLKGLWRLNTSLQKRWEGWAPPPRVK